MQWGCLSSAGTVTRSSQGCGPLRVRAPLRARAGRYQTPSMVGHTDCHEGAIMSQRIPVHLDRKSSKGNGGEGKGCRVRGQEVFGRGWGCERSEVFAGVEWG